MKMIYFIGLGTGSSHWNFLLFSAYISGIHTWHFSRDMTYVAEKIMYHSEVRARTHVLVLSFSVIFHLECMLLIGISVRTALTLLTYI